MTQQEPPKPNCNQSLRSSNEGEDGPHWNHRPWVFAGSTGAIAFGIIGLAWWALQLPIHRGEKNFLPQMVPNSALCFVALGISLWVFGNGPPRPRLRWMARCLCAAVMVLALLTLGEHVFGWRLGMDVWLFSDRLTQSQSSAPGRPALITALHFFLLATSQLILNWRPRLWFKPSDMATVVVLLVSTLGLIGYICDVPAFNGWQTLFPRSGMALSTLVGFLVLGVGTLCAARGGGLAELVASDTTVGWAARRLLFCPVFIPVLAGGWNWTTKHYGWFAGPLAEWILTLVMLMVFVIAIWWSVRLLHDTEKARQEADLSLREANASLERRVQERTDEAMRSLLALHQSEDRWRKVLDTALDAVITADGEGRITGWNKQAETIFGWEEHEVLGRDLLKTILPPKANHDAEAYKSVCLSSTQGETSAREWLGMRRDGNHFPMEISMTQIRLGGKPLCSAFIRDVTERKRAEIRQLESLKEVNDLKTALDEHAIVAITDPRGRITYVNDKFCEISKYSREELLGQDHRLINSGHHPQSFIKDLWNTIARGQVWKGEIRNRAKDGQHYWVDTTIVPFLGTEGKPAQYVAIRADITERKRADDEIHRLNSELEQRVKERTAQLESANQEMEAFSYSVSHDLRAPLRHIAGFVQLLQEEMESRLTPTSRHYLSIVTEASEQMGELIDNLLGFARVSRKELRRTCTCCRSIVEEVIAEFHAETTERGIQWTVESLPEVTADRALLKQVWRNLLSNAVKYTRDSAPPRIRVGSQTLESELEFWVEDNGAGFDMSYVEKLFGVFQRLHLSDEFEGTGIGLANVRRIINRHGGRTWAEGKVGKGAKFCFSLPRFATPALAEYSIPSGARDSE